MTELKKGELSGGEMSAKMKIKKMFAAIALALISFRIKYIVQVS